MPSIRYPSSVPEQQFGFPVFPVEIIPQQDPVNIRPNGILFDTEIFQHTFIAVLRLQERIVIQLHFRIHPLQPAEQPRGQVSPQDRQAFFIITIPQPRGYVFLVKPPQHPQGGIRHVFPRMHAVHLVRGISRPDSIAGPYHPRRARRTDGFPAAAPGAYFRADSQQSHCG